MVTLSVYVSFLHSLYFFTNTSSQDSFQTSPQVMKTSCFWRHISIALNKMIS